MKVKICGITRSQDVSKCEGSGANLIGFINIKRSKRYVKLEEIIKLVSELKAKKRAVLVLEPKNPEEVVMKMKKTGIRNVQLHSLTSSQIKYLKWIENFHRTPVEPNMKIIRAVGISEDSIKSYENKIEFSQEKVLEIEDFAKTCDAILFDYQVKGRSGGTGKQIPINMALEAIKIAKDANYNLEIFLAGGINSERIQDKRTVLERVIDYVDVNSGVEDAPGIKNSERVEELMNINA
ncbi:MAG: phosphoribosylanthranilate isomerase [Methanobacterium sp.]|uniref:phosphoribosylanthranilate isomerase n=1 Tax=Methanobacterium sp. TaxID=2164 RepID=UPI003C785A63